MYGLFVCVIYPELSDGIRRLPLRWNERFLILCAVPLSARTLYLVWPVIVSLIVAASCILDVPS